MIFGIESILNKLRNNSEEKVDGGLYVTWYGNTIFLIICAFLLHDVFLVIFGKFITVMYIVATTLLCLALIVYIATRRACFGVTKSGFVYIKLKHFLFKEKDVFEIPIKRIKYLDVKKILGVVYVKLYFISNTGKFERLRFGFSSLGLGFNLQEYKKNYQIVYKRLMDEQKILDKGDF